MATKNTQEVVKEIALPKEMVITAGAKAVKFIPYKENFVTNVPAGKSMQITARTVGQYLYYIKQGFVEGTGSIVINVPAEITIMNNNAKTMNFVPYRENFSYELEAGKGVKFKALTAGQVLYYLAQDTTGPDVEGGLDVVQVPATDANGAVEEGAV